MSDLQPFRGRVLTVAGTDPTCGAGIPMDLNMITRLGGIPQAAVTAVTVQDTSQVTLVHPLSASLVAQQMRAAINDIGVDCIKLGMLATAEIVKAVVEILEENPHIPVVADPVLAGTGGGVLLNRDGLDVWHRNLLPRLTLITPNLPEARILITAMTSQPPPADPPILAISLTSPGCSVLLKGGHGEDGIVVDWLAHRGQVFPHHHPRLPGKPFHGTGCALASAIATGIALGQPLELAVAKGLATVLKAMDNGIAPGRGQRLLRP
ncbi:MAG: hydroxymethylpyrimidine/phosphomethylpyrimidine kinase [Magnetococcales bacterium]|nr:hydroxymethylpyrimidine/phosphomethylpyrimidine kinase [Magnetococcales bacterium]